MFFSPFCVHTKSRRQHCRYTRGRKSLRPSEIGWIRLRLRIQALHLIEFLSRDLRQVPYEQNQAPGLRGIMCFAERWHAAQTNSIVDCGVEFAIGLVLRPGCTQIWRFRIESLAK